MGVPVVNTFIGADASKPLAQNIAESRQMVTGLVEAARAAGIKLAIENCPMIFSADEWPGGHNLFYSPATWREVFGWFDDDTLGLNLDPSHLIWQMIDIERVVREFGDRIYHVHAKDLDDRSRGSLRSRDHVGGRRLAGASDPGAGRGALEPFHGRAVPGRVHRTRHRRARGPQLRGARTTWSRTAS